jgi:hypothetical protein
MAREVNMVIHARRKRVTPASFIVLLAIALSPWAAFAQATVNYYSTAAASGTENYAVIANAGTVPIAQPVRFIAACSYNSTAPELIMLFDAKALPSNGTVPKMEFVLPAAGGANAPSCGSLPLPPGGVSFHKGAVVAASTAGKTLTVDTASSGNTFFEVGY